MVTSQRYSVEAEGLASKGLLEKCIYFKSQNVAFEVFLPLYNTPVTP